ncbi:MAG TPA: hypothetical protein VGG85_19035 [Terracidiphilus sp.]|jgi:hypothetical protein
MKRFICVLVLFLMSVPAWSAGRKITVGELTNLMRSMQQQKKNDADVAAALKQLELTEALTRPTMNSLVAYVPGPLSTEQVYVLEAGSAMLAPPPSDIPNTPAPDVAAQKALIDKAADYISKFYAQLPALTATKTVIRFQDNVEAAAGGSGLSGSAKDVSTGSAFVPANHFIHYINSTEIPVETQNGIEKISAAKDKIQWGANGQIVLKGQSPMLTTVLDEAQGTGKLNWLRWELVNGKQAAVFSFAVDKKRTRYAVNYCCFPESEAAGKATFTSAALTGSGGASGNFQTNTDWHNFKTTVPYHGEIFINPETGIVVRLITMAEFKNTDLVHQEDQRIDYAPVPVGDKTLVVPVKSVINTEVVPNGDSGSAGRYTTRHTLFTSEYKDYQLAGATAQK